MIPRLFWCSMAVVLLGAGAAAEQTYRQAEIDPRGQLRIVTSSGREIVLRKDKEQVE